MYVYVHVFIYIYIYTHACTDVHVYIYMYLDMANKFPVEDYDDRLKKCKTFFHGFFCNPPTVQQYPLPVKQELHLPFSVPTGKRQARWLAACLKKAMGWLAG